MVNALKKQSTRLHQCVRTLWPPIQNNVRPLGNISTSGGNFIVSSLDLLASANCLQSSGWCPSALLLSSLVVHQLWQTLFSWWFDLLLSLSLYMSPSILKFLLTLYRASIYIFHLSGSPNKMTTRTRSKFARLLQSLHARFSDRPQLIRYVGLGRTSCTDFSRKLILLVSMF